MTKNNQTAIGAAKRAAAIAAQFERRQQRGGLLTAKPYGYELIMDLHGCNVETFNRQAIDAYFQEVCEAIKMERCARHFWDDEDVPVEDRQTLPHTKGTSAVQFIITSSIVIHTLDLLAAAYVNIFSCNWFDHVIAQVITKERFGATSVFSHWIKRR